MGAPFDGLIPATILLDNPGVTKEEFMELLQGLKVKGDWNFLYFSGLEGLARILNLRTNPDYYDASSLKKD